MAYDLHIVRTRDWLEASKTPIEKSEVDALVASDPELEWSTSDYVDMSDETGTVTRYFTVYWKGAPCFWWYRHEILFSDPTPAQHIKLLHIARKLNAYMVGDDGELYEIEKGFFGKEKVKVTNDS